MNRSDNDTWDLASSVGATATMVAAARAAASRRADPIISDTFAEPLVRAAGVELFARLASGELEYADIGSAWMPDYFGARAKFFDAFFPAAFSAGIRQAVIVGSGLDSRAYRLEWAPETVVYEIDQPEVLAFKNVTLGRLGADPKTEVRPVEIDLRQDWPAALRAAGFNPAEPTAWLAEGLMIGYLPGHTQDRMLEQITALSAPGSRLAADYPRNDSASMGSLILRTAEDWRRRGYAVDFGTLTYAHGPDNVQSSLQARGWQTVSYHLTDLLTAAEVPVGDMDTGPGGQGALHYLTATRR
ncbi:SAM-dependent methyltransferase [Mycolicibacter kumamotonensis]|uniref:S-adenosyl-L-methionine-dependent methyltransferase n=1 Tax=Mycolicibacter kumamotonensis TaxID=354243 RepID=A0A1B8SJ44_9MYCO|nr:SAM-dependent methyltransferase [Mycolicibacter kumamotonensis]OBY32749.1 SAM-dependent methyltransferase [Mycolicibacter kumamotonensis]